MVCSARLLCVKHRHRRLGQLILVLIVLIACRLGSAYASQQSAEPLLQETDEGPPLLRRDGGARAIYEQDTGPDSFKDFGDSDADDVMEDEDDDDNLDRQDDQQHEDPPESQSQPNPDSNANIAKSLPLERDGSGRAIVTVTDFGALHEGTTLSTESFNAAVRFLQAQGGGTLVVPAGEYHVTTVYLASNIVFRMEKGAMIFASDKESDWSVVSYRSVGHQDCVRQSSVQCVSRGQSSVLACVWYRDGFN